MKRRSMLIGGGACFVSAPVLGPTSALANPDEKEDGGPVSEFDRVRLFLPQMSRLLVVTTLILLTTNAMWGWDLRRPVRKLPLNRANTSNIPLLGGLTRRTVQERVAIMDFLGTIYLVNTAMVLILTTSLPRPKKALIANKDSEYVIEKRARPVKADTLRARVKAGGGAKIGTAWFDPKKDEFAAIIPPTSPRIQLRSS